VLWKLGRFLPQRLSYFTFGFASRLLTQMAQRRLIRQIVQRHRINVVHQPMPVSPKEPSLIFDVGAPVVIGPMNGGMNYPPAFQWMQSRFVDLTLNLGRLFSDWLNWLIPGKRHAATLLVANARTRDALPKGSCSRVVELYENGVDLAIWRPKAGDGQTEGLETLPDRVPLDARARSPQAPITKFVFVGRLVHWKAVNLLLAAFKQVAMQFPVELEIIGDGPESEALQQQARELGLLRSDAPLSSTQASAPEHHLTGSVHFLGWLSQSDCAERLQQADVMVLPSMLECGGAAVLESMAIGIPVIATNWGGPAEYLNESCGILIDPRQPDLFVDDLAIAMTRMASAPDLRRSMGQMARKRAVNHFDWDVKVDAILEIYRGVLGMTTANQSQPASKASVVSRAFDRSVHFEH